MSEPVKFNKGFNRVFNKVFDKVFSAGFEEGFESGHDTGHEEGYKEGVIEISKSVKFNKSFNGVFNKEFNAGFEEGFECGKHQSEKEVKIKLCDYDSDDYKEGYNIGVMESSDWAFELLVDRADKVSNKKNLFNYSDLFFKMLGLKGVLDKVYNEIRKQGYDDGFEDGREEGFDKGCEFGLNKKEIKD